ncbi:hypothetical protein F5B19DRAFT_163703 [Rostrohypoxylon terebratum]|nr:hypothetical protein F5B19DRAFT_163703 [Rostrohypoxylon terebratum]
MFFQDVISRSKYDPSGLWTSMVSRYSKFTITKHSDKLPAIGAVAHQFQNALSNEQYLAGLWSGSLRMDLLWHVLDGVRETSTNVPTWSWASMAEGWVLWSRGLHPHKFTSTVEVRRATCHYGPHNSFGVPKRSQLILRGPLLQCWVSKKDNSERVIFHDWLKPVRWLKPIWWFKSIRKLRLKPRIKSTSAGAPNPAISASKSAIDDHTWLPVPRKRQPKTVYLLEVARNDAEGEYDDECYNSIYFLVLRRKNCTYNET